MATIMDTTSWPLPHISHHHRPTPFMVPQHPNVLKAIAAGHETPIENSRMSWQMPLENQHFTSFDSPQFFPKEPIGPETPESHDGQHRYLQQRLWWDDPALFLSWWSFGFRIQNCVLWGFEQAVSVFESWRQLRSTYDKLDLGDWPLSPKLPACIIQVEYVKKTLRMLDTVFRISILSIRIHFQLGWPPPQNKNYRKDPHALRASIREKFWEKKKGEKKYTTSTVREPTCFELRVFGPHRSEGHRLKSYSPPRRRWNPLLHGRTRLKQAPISRMVFPRPKCHDKVSWLLPLSPAMHSSYVSNIAGAELLELSTKSFQDWLNQFRVSLLPHLCDKL